MVKFIKKIGWEILEYIRRCLTPFFIKLMFGMTMLAILFIENVGVRIILMIVIMACDWLLSFVIMRSVGEQAYKMKVTGALLRANKPTGGVGANGIYRPCKEYRGYKGFLIGFIVCLAAIVLILVAYFSESAGVKAALLFIYGWAYAPVVIVYMIAMGTDGTEIIPSTSALYTLILIGIFLAISTVAYILGGNKEKLRQYMLERNTKAIEAGKAARKERNGQEAGKR